MNEEYYDLRLNKKQLQVLKDVCELRFRLDLLQGSDLAELLATMNRLDLSPDNPNHKVIFDRYIQRRDCLEAIINALFEVACPWGIRTSELRKRDKDSQIAEDIWQTIRYQLWKDNPRKNEIPWTVDSREPLQCSDQPLPKIKRVKEEK